MSDGRRDSAVPPGECIVSCARIVKQTPGSEMVAGVTLRIQRLPGAPRHRFISQVDCVSTGMEATWVTAIEESVLDAINSSPCAVATVSVELLDVYVHVVDSIERGFEEAARQAMADAMKYTGIFGAPAALRQDP